ncbi:hypothetical protein GGU11DRAFT_555192 [Lentinula aff. detonsa]|nr:hypothetical protein GGU11DRAFT_555192 [Lentinula aff. detonsa]
MNSRLTSERLVVVGGEDTINHLNSLAVDSLYEELQLCTVDAGFPQEDVSSFACRTHYFGIIFHKNESKNEELELCSPPKEDSLIEEPGKHSLDIASWTNMNDVLENNGTQEDTELGMVVGIMYLISSQAPPYPPGSIGELSFGIIISQDHRGKGYAKEALRLILDEAFMTMNCHRIQVCLLDTYAKDRAMRLFMGMRFVHEGRRRRAFFSILEQEWKDTTCLAILDTEWLIRSKYLIESPPATLWDELLSRHNQEREELLRWEEAQSQSWPAMLKRTSSTETVRANQYLSDTSDDTFESAVSSDADSSYEESLDLSNKLTTQPLNKGKGRVKRSIISPDFRAPFNPFFSDSEESDEFSTSKKPRFHYLSSHEDFNHDDPSGSLPKPVSSLPLPHPPSGAASSSFVAGFVTERSRDSSLSEWEDEINASADDPDGYASSTPSSHWSDLLEPRELASPTYSYPEMSDSPSELSEDDYRAL